MASRQATVDFILDQVGGAGFMSAKKMFGEYGLYCGGKLFALVCDDKLFFKPTIAGEAYAGALEQAVPYPGAKPYLLVPGDRWDESDWLTELTRVTVAALPTPAAKTGTRQRPSQRRPSHR